MIENSTFEKGVAGSGGAISLESKFNLPNFSYANLDANAEIKSCEFYNNESRFGGAIRASTMRYVFNHT